ncbi:gag-pol polyprotein [Tanacetum coccineum]
MLLEGIGSVDTPSVALFDVYYIPSLTMNLASVRKIYDSGCDVNFSVSDCSIYDRKTKEVVGTRHRQGDLYVLDHFRDIHDTASSSLDLSSFWSNRSSSAFYLWHSRGCKLVKFSALPFSNSVSSSKAPFDLVHYDVWGPSPISIKGYGTIYQTSCMDIPQQNGVSERKHRYLIETSRSFLLSADVPIVFWGEAFFTATYVINRITIAHNYGLSPFEKLYGTLPDYSSLHVFDCTCFVLKPHVERTKLSAKSTLCVFLGYGVRQKGYRCYDPIGQKLYTSRHADFLEHIPYYFVPANSHNLTQSELIKIDPFEEPTLVVSPIKPKQVFETLPVSNTPPQTTTTTETSPSYMIPNRTSMALNTAPHGPAQFALQGYSLTQSSSQPNHTGQSGPTGLAQSAGSGISAGSAGSFGSFGQLAGQETILQNTINAMTLQDTAMGNWYMDTGASSHLNDSVHSLSDVLNMCIYPSVSNLIYVRQFVRDNNSTVEFDAFGFSIKDFMTRRVLLRSDTTRDLYSIMKLSAIPHAFLTSQHTWHQCLGHPGSEVLRHILSSNSISCTKEKPPVFCHAC